MANWERARRNEQLLAIRVSGDGQSAGASRGLFPFVGHCLGVGLFLLLVAVAHGAVAGGQVFVAYGAVMVAGLAGGLGFGVGADGGQGGVEGAEAR